MTTLVEKEILLYLECARNTAKTYSERLAIIGILRDVSKIIEEGNEK